MNMRIKTKTRYSNNKVKSNIGFSFLPPAIFVFPIALFAPLDSLQYPYVGAFVKFVESFVPMISMISTNIETWQVSKLYFSAVWCFFPMWVIFHIYKSFENKQTFLKTVQDKKQTVLERVIFIIFMAILVWFLWGVGPTDHERAISYFTTYSRLGMATLGVGFIFLTSLLCMLIVMFFFSLMAKYKEDTNG